MKRSGLHRRRLWLGSVAALEILVAGPALAQSAEGPPGPDRSPTARLGDIVVTARRREENVQDIPIALSVVSNELLDSTGTSNVGQLTQLVPSLQILSSNPRNTSFTIRGLGASYGLANDGLEQGVGLYVDQVYNARPATATLDFIDIDRIEVLRGPQGTLFGKNTTAGALNITTRAPTFTLEGVGEVTIGDYGLRQIKGTVAGPLYGDVVAGRLSFVSNQRDGFLTNVTNGENQNNVNGLSLRGQLLIQPDDRLSVRLSGDHSRQETNCCAQVYVTYGPTQRPAAQQFPNLAAGRAYALASLNPYDRLSDVDFDIQADQWHAGGSAIVDYDFGDIGFTSVTAYREWDWEPANDRDYTALDIIRQSANPSHQNQFSQEFRIGSQGSRTIDWTAGLYYFDQTIDTDGVTEYGRDASYWLLGPTVPSALLDGYKVFNVSSINTESWAVFGQFTWNITDRFRVTPGLRYTDESKSGTYTATTAGGLVTTDATLISRRLGIARPQTYSAEISDGSVSGQIAASYDINDDVLVYGSYARGFKSGGINMAGLPTLANGLPALNSVEVDPEEVTTYELGLKTQSFDRRLTANLAAYYTEIADFQANVVDAGPGALRGYLANVEKVEIRGVELDLTARPTDRLDLYANLAWTDGEYASFANGPCPLERIGPATAACDLSGKEFPGVSPWAGSIGGEYRWRVERTGGEILVGADASYRSAYFADAAVSEYARIDGYGLVNLRAGYRSDAGWEAQIFVRNALDEDYLQFVSIQTGNSGLVIGNPGDPRTVGVTLRARY
ncbi:TonB-dependent receptor [Brevundimonas variabilis]|uniref:Iron complex outermembrane receptor protein n=1 Tax=Brevundimonas variabilis TaxID=74312 RepID=A0A7W9FFG6_9CAUL|nr:TonB-dependent receptor [Brevundimonas variabilis]MBB5747461.1 iron complex outermembrane receptor protein [Brevundimonas variabilis]